MAASMNQNGDGNSASETLGPSANTAPNFDFCEFFHGHTRVSGWFSDRFGKPRRHFCGDFYGYYRDEKFVLDEKLFYTDGVVETRVWDISISDSGRFSAQSDSLVGDADGQIVNNILSMHYSMEVLVAENKHWKLDMKDTMILQPDGSLHNITRVNKWGLCIGIVSSQYMHHDGDQLCSVALNQSADTNLPVKKAKRYLTSVGNP